ncbi:MAG: hypothetical protein M1837_001020 [Sclerophora amabilis]|nr:MAG: hypothetical protein M1837_001020 [Sclerophora amabilis]
MNTSRNEIFQKLKPCCVELSQIALTWGRTQASSRDIVTSLESLQKALKPVARPGSAFDKNLADYVFFPLSHVFRPKQGIPERALELALQCLDLLLKSGWRHGLPTDLGRQILILLTLIIGQGSAAEKNGSSRRSEELQRVTYDCMCSLFASYDQSNHGDVLTDASVVPNVLDAVTLMLSGLTDGASNEIQLSAISALDSFQSCIRDKEVLASFMPGTVSSLTKVLRPTTSLRRSYKVLRACLGLLAKVLQALLADSQIQGVVQSNEALRESMDGRVILTSSWLKATASQVKLALATVVQLRHSSRADVRHALCELCLVVLEQCRSSLSESVSMMVETMIILSEESGDGGTKDIAGTLKHLAIMDPSILDSIKSSLHNWVVSLPRLMQSNDDRPKRRVISQISISVRLLSELGDTSDVVDDILAANLRDSISAAIRNSSQQPILSQGDETSEISSSLAASGRNDGRLSKFQPVLVGRPNQQETLQELQLLLKQLGSSEPSLGIAQDMLNHMRGASGDGLLATFWLSLTLVRNNLHGNDAVDDLINYGISPSDTSGQLLEELYAYSLSALSRPWSDSPEDWRVQALSLETIALQAQRSKEDFRPELVDVLYPVVHLIGSPILQLRTHAMTCLNILSQTCGYPDTSTLIISNVDYLVNAVALKLNTFDISPQAPQVLLMMIKLSGPSLIPYLDDLVGSVFAALDSFHGYPRLVELLFSVLGGIVEEGSRPDVLLAITSGKETIDHRKKPTTLRSIDDVLAMLDKRKQKRADEAHPSRDSSPTPDEQRGTFPRKPWKADSTNPTTTTTTTTTANDLLRSPSTSQAENDADNEEEADGEDDNKENPTDLTPTPTKTYTTIHSISRLTQHYLSHASPTLRLSLLRLLRTSLRPLSTDEDAFLPLVNDIWAPLALRLHDPEPFVVAAAADAVALMCRAAGDFMAGRVEAEWGGWKKAFGRWETESGVRAAAVQRRERTKKPTLTTTTTMTPLAIVGASAGAGGGGGGGGSSHKGRWSQAWRTWESFVGLFGSVVGYVRVGDGIREDVLEMMAPYLEMPEAREVKGFLEEWNEDAVWWEMMMMMKMMMSSRRGGKTEDEEMRLRVREVPRLDDGVKFTDFTTM